MGRNENDVLKKCAECGELKPHGTHVRGVQSYCRYCARLRSIYNKMISRCYNKKDRDYPRYGGVGIRVCKRWRESYKAWKEDMGPRPEGYTIERLDNDGDYEKSNCEWASRTEQARNRTNSRIIEAFGTSKTLAEWAEDYGLAWTTLYSRLRKGMTPEVALTKPTLRRKKRKDHRSLSEETIEKIRRLKKTGMAAHKIASQLGVGRTTVFRYTTAASRVHAPKLSSTR